jgi:class 3 adenylate cyclase
MADQAVQRRLSAILAADIVGYSRLMDADEDGTYEAWRAARTDVVDPLIAEQGGRIVKHTGDGFLAEFPTVQAAMRCALGIQEQMAGRNADVPDGRRLEFRIGINLGDIIVDAEDIHGDGVNIAARLEGLADPGGICVSGPVYEAVHKRFAVHFEDLGDREVKNISNVRVYKVGGGAVSVRDGEAAPQSARAAPALSAATPPVSWRRRNWLWAAAAAVALAALAGGIGYWRFAPVGVRPLSSFPENVSTGNMKADDIAAFMAGMKISGHRTIDGAGFTITLNPDKTTLYEFAGTGNLQGTTERIVGKWWVKDYRFCMQMRAFNFGKPACPVVTKHGRELTALRPKNGAVVPLTFSK